MSGSLDPLMFDTPRRRIEVPAPKLPELNTMSRPAIRPCKASSTVVNASPSNSAISRLCLAVDTSSSGIERPEPSVRFFDVITTSSIWLSLASLMSYFNLLKGRVTVLHPTYVTRSEFLGFLSLKEKLPLISVTAYEMIRLAASISTTLAPITGPNSSVMTPLIISPDF